MSVLPSKFHYVISGDLRVLLNAWTENSNGRFFAPSGENIRKISAELISKIKEIFSSEIEVVYLSWEEINAAITGLKIKHAGNLPIISLDPVYSDSLKDVGFDTSRICTWENDLWKSIGRGNRPGSPSVEEQLMQIFRNSAFKDMKEKKVIVIDDGIWHGETLANFEELLRIPDAAGNYIIVEKFLVGMKFNDLESLNNTYLKKPLAPIINAFEFGKISEINGEKFQEEKVIDWICERDFFSGIEFSGRTVGRLRTGSYLDKSNGSELFGNYNSEPFNSSNYGAPYVAPLGYPIDWASIPAHRAIEFSAFCLDLTARLYQMVEEATSMVTGEPCVIKVEDLARPPYHLWHSPMSLTPPKYKKSIVEALYQSIEFLRSNPDCVK